MGSDVGARMTSTASLLLLALAYLLAKHMVADFLLQTRYQFSNKHIYGHLGGALHAAIHVMLTLPVFLILPPLSLAAAATVVAVEFLIHYHVDYIKEWAVHHYRLKMEDAKYWWALGFDQLLHQMTYVAMVAYLSV